MIEQSNAKTRRHFVGSAAAAVAGAAAGTIDIRPSEAAPKNRGQPQGQWSPVYSWPDVAIHLNLLPSGKVLSFSDDNHDDPFTGTRLADFTKAFVIDVPAGQAPSTQYASVNNTTTNMFCSGHGFLPDGRLIVAGGHEGTDGVGSTDTNILEFNGSQYAWRIQASTPMAGGRWYPSMARLANGELVVMSGSMDANFTTNPIPEVWQTNTGGWRQLTSANLALPLYPMAYLAPNGKVFVAGPDSQCRYLDTVSTGTWTNGAPHAYGTFRDYGSSVVYDDGKVLVAGGGDPPTNTAEIIDLNAPNPVWQVTSAMQYARRQANATVLPDGKVLVTGGTSSPGFNDGTQAVMAAEMWDPATGRWTTMASMQIKRCYHSTAMLLPDGRVLSAGGGRPAATNATDNKNAEIFSPPYLFTGARPTITSAPPSIRYGQGQFQVGVSATAGRRIQQVTLLGLGSVSHTVNMNQRFTRLLFSTMSGGVLVSAPTNRNLVSPGHYMLFLIDDAGAPSVASIIQIS